MHKATVILFILLLSLSLAACSLSSSTMTAPAFERIPIGASITEVETQVGAPYSVSSQSGMQHYRYIERIQTGPGIISQNTYILTVREGEVIDKQCSNESQSFNLQIR